MSNQMLSYQKPIHTDPVVDEAQKMTRNWFLWAVGVSQIVQFTPMDTSLGAQNFPLGRAKSNQGNLLIVKKITGDGNAVTPVATYQGDTIDNATPLTTVSSAAFMSDGVSTWYRIF